MKTKTKSEYAKERLDPRWQKKRLEIMKRDGFACCDCGAEDVTLNVHHQYYVTGRKPWMYPDWNFQTLCYPCHQNKHDNGENDPDYENWTEEEKWCEQPWETYLGLLDSAIFDESIHSDQAWDPMVELSKIMKTAYDVSMEQGSCIMSVLISTRIHLQSQLKEEGE